MPLFRKRPIIVKAEQWNDKNWREVGVCQCDDGYWDTATGEKHVHTLEGTIPTSPGDWIVIGTMGEKWTVKPGIFEKTYERVSRRKLNHE